MVTGRNICLARIIKRAKRPAIVLCSGLSLLLLLKPYRAQDAQVGKEENWKLPSALAPAFEDGVRAEKAGRLDEAEKDFLQVLGRGGRAAFVYNNLGIVYQERGEHERAVAQFREAIRLKPDYFAPRLLLGASLLALGRTRESVHELERAVKTQPREPSARQELAKAYERAGRLRGVVEQYIALRQIAPDDPEYAYQLGRAYLKMAAWCYEQVARIGPESARAHQIAGENYQMQGRLDLALQAYQRAAQADSKLPGIHLEMGGIYFDQGKVAEAREQVEQELALVPESVSALDLKRKIEQAALSPR
jgi:tetratricopeptide (TPR) repeat protein